MREAIFLEEYETDKTTVVVSADWPLARKK